MLNPRQLNCQWDLIEDTRKCCGLNWIIVYLRDAFHEHFKYGQELSWKLKWLLVWIFGFPVSKPPNIN